MKMQSSEDMRTLNEDFEKIKTENENLEKIDEIIEREAKNI